MARTCLDLTLARISISFQQLSRFQFTLISGAQRFRWVTVLPFLFVLLRDTEQKLPERVQTAIQRAEDETRHCTGVLFNICLSYGARQEIANACRQIAVEVVR